MQNQSKFLHRYMFIRVDCIRADKRTCARGSIYKYTCTHRQIFHVNGAVTKQNNEGTGSPRPFIPRLVCFAHDVAQNVKIALNAKLFMMFDEKRRGNTPHDHRSNRFDKHNHRVSERLNTYTWTPPMTKCEIDLQHLSAPFAECMFSARLAKGGIAPF